MLHTKGIGINDIPNLTRAKSYGKMEHFLTEFETSDDDAVEVFWTSHYKSASSATSCINGAIRRWGKIGMIRACQRGDRVFMFKVTG